MVKFAVIGLNLIAILSLKFFFAEEVSVEQNIPEQVQAGESFVVEVTINKEDREGFAKWQQSLPLGFIAESVETEGATFSFKDQEIKLIWMALPKKESFTISYRVYTEPTLEGDFELIGKFSFIENNERKDVVSSPHKITLGEVGEALLAEATDEEAIETVADTNKERSKEKTETELATKESIPDGNKTAVLETNNISLIREISQNEEEGKYKVTLKIEGNQLSEFAKIEEYLPPNFIASANESAEGIFSFEGNMVKILWMQFPSEPSFEVSYNMESISDEQDSAIVHGVFSYLEGTNSVQIPLKGSQFENTFVAEEAEEVLAAEIEDSEVEEVAEAEEIIEPEPEEVVEEVPNEGIKELNDTQLKEEISSLSNVDQSVQYRVQIAAGKKEVKQAYFEKRHKIKEQVNIEFIDNWYKYTLGSFSVYKDARDKRNQIWSADNKIDDAFVCAYNGGERISVQEALMVTKQKWFK
jgi:hypothetical protein